MTFTERAFKDEAPELRAILCSYARLSFKETRGWFSVLFTIDGNEPHISRCMQEIRAWRDKEFLNRDW